MQFFDKELSFGTYSQHDTQIKGIKNSNCSSCWFITKLRLNYMIMKRGKIIKKQINQNDTSLPMLPSPVKLPFLKISFLKYLFDIITLLWRFSNHKWMYMNYIYTFLYTVYTSIEYIKFILYVYVEMQLNKTFMRLHSPEWKIKQTYHVNGGYTSHTHTHTHTRTPQNRVKGPKDFFCVFCMFSSEMRTSDTDSLGKIWNVLTWDHLYSIPSRFFSAVSLSLSTVVSLGL